VLTGAAGVTGAAGAAGAAGVATVDAGLTSGGAVGGFIIGGLAAAGFAAAGFDAPPPLKKALIFTTSSSVKLASADPLPVTPARGQISTSSLLSTFSSFARA
jgi:hypothetical protein